MKKSNIKYTSKSLLDKINDSKSIDECYPNILELIFSEKEGWRATAFKSKFNSLNIIKESYLSYNCAKLPEIKFKIYQFFKVLKEQKSYEILNNKECISVLYTILHYNYLWIKNPQYWKKQSRNPYRQVESLINYLFSRYETPKFLIEYWFDNQTSTQNLNLISRLAENSRKRIPFKWFFHLSSGKSAKSLPDIYFSGWSKKMAHDFISFKEVLNPFNVIIRLISKNFGGEGRIYPYFYIDKIREGLFIKEQSNFWFSFIEFFSKQAMFDYEHISHVADYVYFIKYETIGSKKPENPNYEIKRKNLNTVLKEAENWIFQLNQYAKAVGIGKIQRAKTESILKQKEQLETKWASSHIISWEYKKTIRLKNNKKVEVEYLIKELLSGLELLEEGRQLNHCVYSYTGSCQRGSCRIYSLREKRFSSSILTIEVRGYSIVQIRGKNNRMMDSTERSIIEEWAFKAGYNLSTR